MLNKKLSFIAYLVILLILGWVIRYFALNPISNQPNARPLYKAALIKVDGSAASAETYRNKIIVLNFWATWCPPCREEMPELSALHSQYQHQNLTVLGIAIDEPAAVAEYLQQSPVTYPVLLTENESFELASQLGNNQAVLPYTIIIDENGNVIETFMGKINKEKLEKPLQKLLKP